MIDEWFRWADFPDDVAYQVLAPLVGAADLDDLQRYIRVKGQLATLPFYKHWRLIRLMAWPEAQPDVPEELFALWREDRPPRLLDGGNDSLYLANTDEKVRLTPKQLPDYIRYFCFVVRGDAGPFILFEKAPEDVPEEAAAAAALARPLKAEGRDEKGNFLYRARMIYGSELYESQLAVRPDGAMTMLDDDHLASVPSEVVPEVPPFSSGSWIRANLHGAAIDTISDASDAELMAMLDVIPPEPLRMLDGVPTKPPRRRKVRPDRRVTVRSEKPAIVLMVELLLEQALLGETRNRLIGHFNARSPATDPLDRFAALMLDASPIVVVESTIPFVERVIAQIVNARTEPPGQFTLCETKGSGPETPMEFSLPNEGPAIVLIPYGIYRSAADVERLVFDMADRDLAAVISCDRLSQLPESLRRARDVVLRLPAMDAGLFATLFERVLGMRLPAGWDRRGSDWVKYVRDTDFEHPRRMRLPPRQALDFIRGQVADRLASVDATHALRLEDLHGMGEAIAWAEDLIADVHAAVAGTIPWSQVDAGVLLVGPPGSGKTSLANAIAREGSIPFVRASASTWMAEGTSLGPHIQAIRRTFREARDFSPSILFIDEIDSLGSREQFASDANSVYQTEVVNAVLEQIQGMDPTAPVIVIGATNHVERVDPALRRSGRLDRVITIPRPNRAGLEDIFGYHLEALGPDVSVERKIDKRVLAGLSVGLTGADVERIVRGAARRARKARRPIRQEDLVAEITNKPRGPADGLRLTPDELERTAVHEAGHALAAFLGPSKGSDIGFVSIVPRDDGTLGFVAPLPDERLHLTRRDYEARLEVYLAGRAAEELRYGADQVSSGAARDLVSATALVSLLVMRSGLTGNGKFFMSDSMSDADRANAEGILATAYDRVLRVLREHESRLSTLTDELVARQELSGAEVRAVLRREK